MRLWLRTRQELRRHPLSPVLEHAAVAARARVGLGPLLRGRGPRAGRRGPRRLARHGALDRAARPRGRRRGLGGLGALPGVVRGLEHGLGRRGALGPGLLRRRPQVRRRDLCALGRAARRRRLGRRQRRVGRAGVVSRVALRAELARRVAVDKVREERGVARVRLREGQGVAARGLVVPRDDRVGLGVEVDLRRGRTSSRVPASIDASRGAEVSGLTTPRRAASSASWSAAA